MGQPVAKFLMELAYLGHDDIEETVKVGQVNRLLWAEIGELG